MLSVRHITHKLRSQSLNEEPSYITKSELDRDRDSGTESDDELVPDPSTSIGKKMEYQDQTNQSTDSAMTTQQRRWIVGGRERTRSESGKENSATAATAIRPQARQRRSDRSSMRERSGSEATAVALALAALSASETETPLSTQHRQQLADSPVDFSVPDSALPSDSDHGHWGDQHSSEEELECINGPEHEPCLSVSAMPPAAIGIPVGGGGEGGNTTALRFGPSAFGPPVTAALDKSPRRSQTPQQQLQGPEKRKWAQVSPRRVTTPSNSSAELVRIKSRPRSAVMLHHRGSGRSTASSDDGGQRSNSSAALDLCYSASSDDEVQSLVGGGAEDSPLPLEFRTSPPEGAHRPTRSLSPPPKLFLADHHHHQHNQHESLPLSLSSSSLSALRTSPFGAAFNATQQQQQQQHGESAALAVANGNAGSPRKRHRHTHHRSHSHGHHMQQRPCLDFEKMQQMKNRSVSTWRHDGELSLFCW